MPTTVEVRFKGNRKDYFLWSDDTAPLRLQDAVIVPVDRGLDFGRITAVGETATKKCASSCSGCAVGEVKIPAQAHPRRATHAHGPTPTAPRRTEDPTRRTEPEPGRARQLDLTLTDAEGHRDRKKLTVYFTAEKRVDFRELVRDLAAALHTRIDLRQIGARDEAARLGGVGRCGKEFCCSSWLTTLSPVSLSLAKDQHLSLNPQQISGGCGRLLCCLNYEHEFYVASRKRFPKEGKTLKTAIGPEKVIAVDIFRERVFLRHEEAGPRIITLVQLKEELELSGELLPVIEVRPPAPVVRENPVEPPVRAEGQSQPSGKTRRRRRGRRGRGGGTRGGGPGPSPSQN